MAFSTTDSHGPNWLSLNAFLGALGTFSGIAIISAIARGFIRFRHLKDVRVDDYVFIAAATLQLVADGLILACFARHPYTASEEAQPPNVIRIDIMIQVTNSFDWSTLFLIKLCFLSYFRGLVDRLSKFQIWWWFILGLLLPTTAVMISSPFIACPHFGKSALVGCGNSSSVERQRALVYYSVASDIVTDILRKISIPKYKIYLITSVVMSIPILILRKSRLDVRRKLTIGLLTCLSLVMIGIALIRAVSYHINRDKNQLWITFWLHIEASVSVIAACPIAYRNLFVIKRRIDKRLRQTNVDRHRRSVLEAIWRRTRPTLPSIGFSTGMTGMSTALRGDDVRSQTDSNTADGTAFSSSRAKSEEGTTSLFPSDSDGPKSSTEAQRLTIGGGEITIGQAV